MKLSLPDIIIQLVMLHQLVNWLFCQQATDVLHSEFWLVLSGVDRPVLSGGERFTPVLSGGYPLIRSGLDRTGVTLICRAPLLDRTRVAPCGKTNKLKILPSCRTTYAGVNEAIPKKEGERNLLWNDIPARRHCSRRHRGQLCIRSFFR